jgi:carboxylesterase type B
MALLFILAIFGPAVLALAVIGSTTVVTTSGPAQGYLDTNTTKIPLHKWYGIRFAADTSGTNRWRAPRPYYNRSVYNATLFGPACLQGRANGGNGTSIQSEDCLRINVIAPVGAKNLPVYLYS